MNSGTRKTLIAGSIVALGTVALARAQKRRNATVTSDESQRVPAEPAIGDIAIGTPAAGQASTMQSMDPAIE
jgi:hypothetical protein